MSQAMIKIRNELGSEAIIVSNRRIRQKGIRNLFKKKVLEVTAIVDEKKNYDYRGEKEKLKKDRIFTHEQVEENTQQMPTQQDNINNSLKDEINKLSKMLSQLMNESKDEKDKNQPKEEVKVKNIKSAKQYKFRDSNTLVNSLDQMMLDGGIIEGFTQFCKNQNMYSNINDEVLSKYFKSILKKNTFKERCVQEKIWAFIGPTGVGKTTTIAKIAAQETINKGKRVGLITLDTYRIGAVEQLRTYANILEIPLKVVFTKLDLRKAIESLKDCDLILIDSTGRSSLNQEHLVETKELLDVIDKKINILVVSASTPKTDLKTIINNYRSISYDYVVLTKMDETNCYGNIFNINFYSNKPLLFITTGQSVPDDIQEATLDNLLNYIPYEVVL